MCPDSNAYHYYQSVADVEMRGDVCWYLIEETWRRTSTGESVFVRRTWADRAPLSLADFLREVGARDETVKRTEEVPPGDTLSSSSQRWVDQAKQWRHTQNGQR